MKRLKEIIQEDKDNLDEYKTFEDENTNSMITSNQLKSEEKEEKDYLVKRPTKNFVWGLGEQTKRRKCKKNFKNNFKLNLLEEKFPA